MSALRRHFGFLGHQSWALIFTFISASLQKFPAYLCITGEKKIFWIGQRRVHPCDIFQNVWENCILNKSHLWFIQTYQLCLSFLTKLSQWQEQMMNGKGIFLDVLDVSCKVQRVKNVGLIPDSLWHVAARLCLQAGCVSKGYCGCNLTLCHTSDLSSQIRGFFISLFNNVANIHSPNIKVLNTPKVFAMKPLIRIS